PRDERPSVTKLIEAIEPSVVQIETNRGFGSGFVLDKSGLIVTCCHYFEDAGSATAVFANGRRLEVLGTVAVALDCDLASLAVELACSFPPLTLSSGKPKKGEPIVVMGSPKGLSFSECEGSVSSLRTVAELSRLGTPPPLHHSLAPAVSLIQISAPLMPGNSG